MRFPSAIELTVLRTLAGRELHGYALAGAVKLGSVYVTLGRMVAKGLLESRDETGPDGARRRLYKLTQSGVLTLAAVDAAESIMSQSDKSTKS